MEVNGPSHIHGPQPINAPHKLRHPTELPPAGGLSGTDEVQISEQARLLEKVSQIPEVRQERIDQIRAEIAGGTYETDEKLDIALDRLLDEIG